MKKLAYTLVPALILVLAACLLADYLPAGPARGASKPPRVYSQRTEPGAHGHVLTTVAFPVRVGDQIYACVVTEDVGNGVAQGQVTVAQSCDFSVSLAP